MAYKDKEKQKEAQKEWVRQKRAKQGSTQDKPQGSTEHTATPEGLVDTAKLPENYGQPDCKCTHCRQDKGRHTINHGKYKGRDELVHNELNRVSLPGDTDYDGVCNDAKYDDRRIAQASPVAAGQPTTEVGHEDEQEHKEQLKSEYNDGGGQG